jgi:two-component system, chemotaxis family, protein-glutamate methylesterase/glutaminase
LQSELIMSKIRVLVVDDSVVIRRLVTDWLTSDLQIEVAGVAANGRIALDKITQINPDIVTLDVDMPEMDGLQALKMIRKDYPRLPVIMFSTLTERGAATTLDALSLGASDYVTKPVTIGNGAVATASVREQLIEKIKALCLSEVDALSTATVSQLSAGKSVTAANTYPRFQKRIEILAVGVSTGGPMALAQLIPAFPVDFPIPLVIVQHMPPVFTKLLAERLDNQAAIQVKEGIEGSVLKPGVAWVAPGNCHMVVGKHNGTYRLGVNHDPPENSCRPAVDVLFRSVAEVYGAASLAVILTGMGRDGFRGCERIREAGGQILAQDQKSSIVWGMPGFVARAGLADKVLPIEQLGREILTRVQSEREKAVSKL